MKSEEEKYILALKKELLKSKEKESQLKSKLATSRKDVKRLKTAVQRADKKKEEMPKNLPDESLLYTLIEQLKDINTRRNS